MAQVDLTQVTEVGAEPGTPPAPNEVIEQVRYLGQIPILAGDESEGLGETEGRGSIRAEVGG